MQPKPRHQACPEGTIWTENILGGIVRGHNRPVKIVWKTIVQDTIPKEKHCSTASYFGLIFRTPSKIYYLPFEYECEVTLVLESLVKFYGDAMHLQLVLSMG